MKVDVYLSAKKFGKTIDDVHLLGYCLGDRGYILSANLHGYFYHGEGGDYFMALQNIRKLFEHDGIEILCNGSRKNVWPSALSRYLGEGIYVYLCKDGQPVREMVDIFDNDNEIIEYCPVREQEESCRKWFCSLKKEDQKHLHDIFLQTLNRIY